MAEIQSPPILSIPNEVLSAILLYVPPESVVNLQLTSKRLRDATDRPIVWRSYCRPYRYWDSDNDPWQISARPTEITSPPIDWKRTYHRRLRIDESVRRNLDAIIAQQHGRLKRMGAVAQHGIEAKDELLRQCATPEDAKDVLARRFYAEVVVRLIHRNLALREWRRVRMQPDTASLERALAAYDMFARRDNNVDFLSVSESLDKIAADARRELPRFEHCTPREKALALVRTLRGQGFRGTSPRSYFRMENSFIGLTLQSRQHMALPLITVAIYCAVASRLGLDAAPVNYPGHIYGVVSPPPGVSLDGYPSGAGVAQVGTEEERMFIDPFSSDSEVPVGDLTRMLTERDFDPSTHSSHMQAGTVQEMVLRTGRNINRACRSLDQSTLDRSIDVQFAASSFLWAHIILAYAEAPMMFLDEETRRRRSMVYSYINHEVANHQDSTTLMLEEFALPLFEGTGEYEMLASRIRSIYLADATSKSPVYRPQAQADPVKFKVGQLFFHKRYGYEGIVTGWDQKCEMGDAWIWQMQVDSLDGGGRNQCFYHVL